MRENGALLKDIAKAFGVSKARAQQLVAKGYRVNAGRIVGYDLYLIECLASISGEEAGSLIMQGFPEHFYDRMSSMRDFLSGKAPD